MRTKILTLILSWLMFVFLGGCASTYGEKDLRSFESDYGRSIPTSPQYKLENLTGDTYSLTVHQGSPLMSAGYVRAEFLLQAATTIARDTCSRAGKRVSDSNMTRAGDSGWVHLQGTFTCGVKEVAQEKSKEAAKSARTGPGINYAASPSFSYDPVTGTSRKISDCDIYRSNIGRLEGTDIKPENQEEARALAKELRQQAAAAGCPSVSDQAAPYDGSERVAFERALAECRWEIRQMTINRQQPAYRNYGYNDPQMNMAANNIAAAIASMPPGPAVMDECLAAKGFRK